jgi:hypothetical protein
MKKSNTSLERKPALGVEQPQDRFVPVGQELQALRSILEGQEKSIGNLTEQLTEAHQNLRQSRALSTIC